MKKTLVVFYSRSGYTRRLARQIAAACDADLEELLLARSRLGWGGYVRSALEALTRTPSRLVPLEYDPSNYELVVIGTPIWVWRPSSPIRAYVAQHADAFKHVAFFCTMGGAGAEGVFRELEDKCAHTPIARLALTDREIDSGQFTAPLTAFVDRLRASLQGLHADSMPVLTARHISRSAA
jgi:menaquinone-dependent protoporphyrinogen IX oxidase